MTHRHFPLAPEAAAALQACEIQERDGPTRIRIQAVRLYGLGFAVPTIHTITGLSRSRLMPCCHAYQQDGLAALRDQRLGGNNRKLTAAQPADLETRLHQYTPRRVFGPEAATPTGPFWTLTDVQAAVDQWYSVTDASPTSSDTLFARCGFTAQRPDPVFTSRRTVDVLDWEAHAEKN